MFVGLFNPLWRDLILVQLNISKAVTKVSCSCVSVFFSDSVC